MRKNVVIFGTGTFAELAYYYLKQDKRYRVVGFTEDKPKGFKFKELPVFSFHDVARIFPPKDNLMFIAIGYSGLNKNRETKFYQAKNKGYKLLTYIHPDVIVAKNSIVGENCFIFERNNIQPFVKIGDGVILWSGNHVGHHSIILGFAFISSHVVISGECTIGHRCFLGVNSSIIDGKMVASDTIIGAGTVVVEDIHESGTYVGVPARKIK